MNPSKSETKRVVNLVYELNAKRNRRNFDIDWTEVGLIILALWFTAIFTYAVIVNFGPAFDKEMVYQDKVYSQNRGSK